MDQHANLTTLADSFGFLVTRLARAMEHDFEGRLSDLGISRTMWAVLASVALDEKTAFRDCRRYRSGSVYRDAEFGNSAKFGLAAV